VRLSLLLRMNACFLLGMRKMTIIIQSVVQFILGETAEDAVKREVLEETGIVYEIDHLAVIHENFFDENQGTLKGVDCHEIAMYFLVKPRRS